MEINELEKHCRKQLERLPKTSGMYEEHLLTLAIIETNKKYFEELETKDKMIDLMAEILTGFEFDRMCDDCPCCVGNGCNADEDIDAYMDCIKKYFRKEVEKDER